MRKIIVSEFVTLDGVMEAPGGEPTHPHSGWVIDRMSAEQLHYKLKEALEAEALLLGRVTYESFAEAWPTRTGEFAQKMNEMPKFVASQTLQAAAWNNTTVLRGDIVAQIKALQAQGGGQLLVAGSRALAQTLMRHHMIDEYRLMIFPVIVGGGRRLFPDGPEKTVLQLSSARSFHSTGVVLNTYHPTYS